jgi:hypothetical protein
VHIKNPSLKLGWDNRWRRDRDSNPGWRFPPILA